MSSSEITQANDDDKVCLYKISANTFYRLRGLVSIGTVAASLWSLSKSSRMQQVDPHTLTRLFIQFCQNLANKIHVYESIDYSISRI